jgi:hypothetical protein
LLELNNFLLAELTVFKEVFTVLKMGTDLILSRLDSAKSKSNLIHAISKRTHRPKLEGLVKLLQTKIQLAQKSNNRFLKAFGLTTTDSLSKYKASKDHDSLKRLGNSLKQFEEALLIFYHLHRDASETTSNMLQSIYLRGYSVLSQQVTYLDAVTRVLLRCYAETLTKDDLTGVKTQSQRILRRLLD